MEVMGEGEKVGREKAEREGRGGLGGERVRGEREGKEGKERGSFERRCLLTTDDADLVNHFP